MWQAGLYVCLNWYFYGVLPGNRQDIYEVRKMELYIGGSYQGKLAYVLEKKGLNKDRVTDGGSCSLEEGRQAFLFNHLHLFLGRMLSGEIPITGSVQEEIEAIFSANPDCIILCDEVGSGIVPLEKKERIYREEVGRVLCMLAKQAVRVERIVCGIGQVIKEEENGTFTAAARDDKRK